MLEGRDWHKVEGASLAEIEQFKAALPIALPESYFSLLSHTNGGEGPLLVQPFWFCLYPVEEVIDIQQAGTFQEFFPNFLVIGGNGSGEAIAFDLRRDAPYPLVAFDMINTNLDGSVVQIAGSFDAALELIGINEGPK